MFLYSQNCTKGASDWCYIVGNAIVFQIALGKEGCGCPYSCKYPFYAAFAMSAEET